MKNKKRWLALGLVGIMTLGCFAGCGSKSDGKSADGKGDSSMNSGSSWQRITQKRQV